MCDIPPLWHTTSLCPLQLRCAELRQALQYPGVIGNLSLALRAGITAHLPEMPSVLSPKLLQQALTRTVPRLLPGRPYLVCPSSLTATPFRMQAFVSKVFQTPVQKPKLSYPSLWPVTPITSPLKAESLLRNLSKVKQKSCAVSGESSPSCQPSTQLLLNSSG